MIHGNIPMITSYQSSLRAEAHLLLTAVGVSEQVLDGGTLHAHSPINGEALAEVHEILRDDIDKRLLASKNAFEVWRDVPAPLRGDFVRQLGNALRAEKARLGRLVTIETGKITSEGLGEVQEMVDICDFAVGLSRQLYGLTFPSERADHRLMEQWHPAGVIGVISAFNFPVAVWCWNAALALVCGNSVIWKPSEKTPLTALAVQAIFEKVARDFEAAPPGLSALVIGDRVLGEAIASSRDVAVVSATGSTRMGRAVGEMVARRFGRAILELGGNNASIVTPSADLGLAVRAIAFGAMGTAGQRCTTLRRLIVHEDIYDLLMSQLKMAYENVLVGNPLDNNTLVGPLIDGHAFDAMQSAIESARAAGGIVHGGHRLIVDGSQSYYVRPALIEMAHQIGPVMEETFAPLLYVLKYRDFAEAIALQNGVAQGLSSSIFANDMREIGWFTSAAGSDCGIANVNMGTSGAEIGGAFGGEKETGGGRESGSDAWKAYMRRQTNAINYGRTLPLAQGVKFDL
jgi:aldehyde dehydrogenase (NAD+)